MAINLTVEAALAVMRSYINTIGISNNGSGAILTLVIGKLLIDSAQKFSKAEQLDKKTSVQCIISAMTDGIIMLNESLDRMEEME
jgi:hypothetical protein